MRSCFLSTFIPSIHPSCPWDSCLHYLTDSFASRAALPFALCKAKEPRRPQHVSSLYHLNVCCCCSHQLQKDQLPVEGIFFVRRRWRRREAGLKSVRVASSCNLSASRGRGARWLRRFDAACESREKKII